MNDVVLSVVSHAQDHLVNQLLDDIAVHASQPSLLVTHNLPGGQVQHHGLTDIRFIENPVAQGFGENHNAAFKYCDQQFFCVINPDIRFAVDPFPAILACFDDPKVGVVAPRVLSPEGYVEDSARAFPTPVGLLSKMLRISNGAYHIEGNKPVPVEWVAGMFMVFRAEAFRDVGGFDEDFFLYYEDVDICTRLWKSGWTVIQHPGVSVIHDAQRTSRRNLRYMKWHITSMLRYFWKHIGRLPKISK